MTLLQERLRCIIAKPALWLLLVACAQVAVASDEAGGFGFDAFMAARTEIASERAAFQETRHDTMLANPQEISGTLVYRAPDYVRKSVIEPQSQVVEVMGDRVLVRDGERERRFGVTDHPALAGMVVAFRATLAGDAEHVRDHYTVAFQGGRDDWEITYTPVDEALAEHIEQIVMRGRGQWILVVETVETGGDRREMRIHHARDGGSG